MKFLKITQHQYLPGRKKRKKKEERKPIPGPVWNAQKLIPVQNW
jgi:hypothetical protein